MSRDLLAKFRSAALDGASILVGVTGVEGISRPYELCVFLTTPSIDDLDAPLGQRATITIDVGDTTEEQHLQGVITGLDVLMEGGGRSLVCVHVAPRLSLLEESRHSRLFTDVALPDVLRRVLTDNGFASSDFDLRLSGDYPAQEHVCQYDESDLAFLSRWMEREGIRYYFEHGAEVEKLVMTDAPTTHEAAAIAPIRYWPVRGHDVSKGRSFATFRERCTSRPGKVSVRDYDYARPGLEVGASAVAFEPRTGEIEVHGYRLFTPNEADRLARVRAEELMAHQVDYVATGVVGGLRSGYSFELVDHPIGRMCRRYLCVELRHHLNVAARTPELLHLTGLRPEATYEVSAVAVPATTPYRPRRRSPWPRVAGFEAATVDGPVDSEYAQIDDQGRYSLRMRFDESGLPASKASTSVRMMQPHGGSPEGFHFPLRKGTEVMVAFLGGDPDRPVISGAVPDAENPSPVTAKNHTRNIVHTGSDNHFEFEDLADGQWIDVRTPPKNTFMHLGTPHDADSHYIVLNTEGDCLFDIGSNQDIDVGEELHENVQLDVSETYQSTQSTTIQGPQTTTVTAGVTETYEDLHMTTVAEQVTEDDHTGHKTVVSGGARLEIFAAAQSTAVSGGLAQYKWADAHHRFVQGDTAHAHDGTLDRHCTGSVTEIYQSDVGQKWGTNTATFAKLNILVPGTFTIVCPTFDLHVPIWNWSGFTVNWTTGLSFSACIYSFANYATQISTTGVNISDQGISSSVAGVSVSFTLLLEIDAFMLDLVKVALSLNLYAFKIEATE